MAISGISGSSSSAASDPQVRALKAKIEDWTDCPTTDASTKKSMQVQLDGLTSAIQSKDDSKQSEAAVVAAATGLGNRIDIRA
jgi:hypothetical protein